jgi:hypothetical protein
MATAGPESSSEKPLHLWPGVAGAIIVVLARLSPSQSSPYRQSAAVWSAAARRIGTLWYCTVDAVIRRDDHVTRNARIGSTLIARRAGK